MLTIGRRKTSHEGQLPRKLAAMLRADVVGHSRPAGEEKRTRRVLHSPLDLVPSTIQGHRGRFAHYVKDAVLREDAASIRDRIGVPAGRGRLGHRCSVGGTTGLRRVREWQARRCTLPTTWRNEL